ARPHRRRAHRHGYRRAQGRAQARRVVARGAQARAARREAIGHTAPAGGGITAAYVMGVFEKLGIAAEMTPKVKLAAGGPNGRVSVLVSSGEVEIGLQQVSELMSNPQVEVIGMLPAELQLTTVYSAGVTTSARETQAALALIKAMN